MHIVYTGTKLLMQSLAAMNQRALQGCTSRSDFLFDEVVGPSELIVQDELVRNPSTFESQWWADASMALAMALSVVVPALARMTWMATSTAQMATTWTHVIVVLARGAFAQVYCGFLFCDKCLLGIRARHRILRLNGGSIDEDKELIRNHPVQWRNKNDRFQGRRQQTRSPRVSP